jgi:phosphoglycerate dehydrogenase-like enzyme
MIWSSLSLSVTDVLMRRKDHGRVRVPPPGYNVLACAPMRIVFCGTGWFPVVDAIRERLPEGATIRTRDFSIPLADDLADVHVILPSNARMDATAIQRSPHLVLIQQPAAGYEAIDLDAARARGVPVCNAPGANDRAVAEAALFLLLALVRRYPEARRAFDRAAIGAPLGRELDGMTLGLIGLGRTGRRLKHMAEALGMQVLAVQSSSSRDDLDRLLEAADAVSIHCPLDAKTRGLIDARALARMKKGALLINCARGPILDRGAVESALESGHLGGLGLDTFWVEPWDPHDALFQRDDVVTLPHVGGSTVEAFAGIADIVADNVKRVMRGEPLRHRIA